MNTGCLLLVRFDDRQKLVGAVEALKGMDNLKHWHAVDGYFGLVLHVNGKAEVVGETEKVATAVSKIDGFTELARCETDDDLSALTDLADDKSHSYLFLEVEPDSRKTVCDKLRELESVSHCLLATGDYNLAAIVTDDSFDMIDRTIKETIRPLDAVLRLRQNRIISLSN